MITQEKAIELLEQAVAQRGADYVYEPPRNAPSCVYGENGTPSCGVGLALFLYDEELFREVERTTNTSTAMSVANFFPKQISTEAGVVLDAFQMLQDVGKTWGEALAGAKFAVEYLR